jgi:imidazole glycerol-phosphate synthase subunit HisF
MLKNRLIPVLFLKHGFLVRSEGFSYHQNLGNPVAQVERYNAWNVDELIYIDITPDNHYDRRREDLGIENPDNIYDIISLVSRKCFMPLTVGGKIRTLEDIHKRLALGADKVTINSKAIEAPEFIKEAAAHFGSQSIVISIDVRKHDDGSYEIYSGGGKIPTGLKPHIWAKEAENMGAGEILLNSIDRDGRAVGYDLDLLKIVNNTVSIPVIACGGVGNYQHFAEGLQDAGISAVAAGNIFHFKEMSYLHAKQHLKKAGLNVR